jgi:hypothetical protein
LIMLLTCMFALRIDLENPASSGCSTCVCAGQADLESQVLLQDQLKLSGIDSSPDGGLWAAFLQEHGILATQRSPRESTIDIPGTGGGSELSPRVADLPGADSLPFLPALALLRQVSCRSDFQSGSTPDYGSPGPLEPQLSQMQHRRHLISDNLHSEGY